MKPKTLTIHITDEDGVVLDSVKAEVYPGANPDEIHEAVDNAMDEIGWVSISAQIQEAHRG